MNIRISESCDGIDWTLIPAALKEAGMGYHSPELHEKAFRNSYAVVFLFDGNLMAGFGRVISDGAYQAALYDIVVMPAYRGKGLGRIIMDRLMEKVPPCNVILYANPGKEGFYERRGFRLLKTGMGRFLNPEVMEKKGML
ncbi:MAG: hypothetical protein CSYNP_00704 [Syntrophus sp. SKADARSKE-3]|nr:hypothetical protein [Syntrophus sp. SKADARSKE-3]